jgi:pyruvate dehydrogenase complex dehydrogenase (E1) component
MSKSKEYYEIENSEWLDSIDHVIKNNDPSRVQEILSILQTGRRKPVSISDVPGIHPMLIVFLLKRKSLSPGA